MKTIEDLKQDLQTQFGDLLHAMHEHCEQLTIEIAPENLLNICNILRDHEAFNFEQLIDVCGLDYLDYGKAEWVTDKATSTGFERAAMRRQKVNILKRQGPRFAVVYHLLSLHHNQRLRIRVYTKHEPYMVPSVVSIWPSANWFERETYDLFGILFDGHPDLRRLLTDYGFTGYPLRKDFPVSGYVQMRYDATEQRVIYEKVDVEPRVLVPKIIRTDSRYLDPTTEKGSN